MLTKTLKIIFLCGTCVSFISLHACKGPRQRSSARTTSLLYATVREKQTKKKKVTAKMQAQKTAQMAYARRQKIAEKILAAQRPMTRLAALKATLTTKD